MDIGKQTRREVLLDIVEEPIASFDALVERCHRALSAQLWMACCWSRDGRNWNVGDYNYLVLSVSPDEETSLYMQFWSEPGEKVLTEIGSGEWCPGAIRYIGPAQRKALKDSGYAIGGRADNYRKELVIDSAAAAEAAALEALRIFFDVFGYRGQWRLELERHRGAHAEPRPVYASLSADEFAKIARRAGCEATVNDGDDNVTIALKRGRRSFVAFMEWPVPGRNRYSIVKLQADLLLKGPLEEGATAWLNARLRHVKVWRTGTGTLRIQMALLLEGGVTEAWIRTLLQHWIADWRECRTQLRRGIVPERPLAQSQNVELIH